MNKKKFLILMLSFFLTTTTALANKNKPHLYLGAGALDLYPYQIATDGQSHTNALSTLWPYFIASFEPWHFLVLRTRFDVLGRKSTDDTATIRFQTLDIAYQMSIINWLKFQIGAGLFSQIISGSGGTIVLPNGTSTATFAKPGDSVLNVLTLLTTGIRFSISRFNFGIYLLATGVLSARRAFSATLDVSIRLF